MPTTTTRKPARRRRTRPAKKLDRILRTTGGSAGLTHLRGFARSSRNPEVEYHPQVWRKEKTGRVSSTCDCRELNGLPPGPAGCWHVSALLDALSIEPDADLPTSQTECSRCGQTGAYGAERLCVWCRL